MLRRPPRSTRTTHSFPTRRSSDLGDSDRRRIDRALAAWRLRRGQCGAEPLFLAALPAAVRHRWRGHPPHLGAAYSGIEQSDRRGSEGAAAYAAVPSLLYGPGRSEEHTSELQSLMRISYAV